MLSMAATLGVSDGADHVIVKPVESEQQLALIQ